MTLKIGDYVAKEVMTKSSSSLDRNLIDPDINPEEQSTEEELNPDEKDKRTDVPHSSSQITEDDLKDVSPLPPAPLKKWQKVFYVGILMFGTVMLVLELISFFA